jgi:hypothetical protein
VSWLRRNWKSVITAIAVAVGSLAADHTIGHKVSDVVVKVLPLIPDAEPPAAPVAPAQP